MKNSFLRSTLLAFLIGLQAFAGSKEQFQRYFSLYEPHTYTNEFSPTIGQEVEGILPSNYTRPRVAQEVETLLRSDEKISEVRRESNQVYYKSSSGKERKYHFKYDSSVQGGESIEVVSPIIASEKEYERFLKVIKKVKEIGSRTPIRTAGLHTHVGFKNAGFPELKVLTVLWGAIERKVTELFHVHPHRAQWAENLSSDLTRVDSEILDRSIEQARSESGPKYRKLNLKPLLRQSTVEFRFANATYDEVVLQGKQDFVRNLVRAIRTKKPELVEYITTTEGANIDLKELGRRIGANYFVENYDQISELTKQALESAQRENQTRPNSSSSLSNSSSHFSQRPVCPNCGSSSCPNAFRGVAQ